MLSTLPRELREELWKFVHYIPAPKDHVLDRMIEEEVMHYQNMIPVDNPPCLPLFFVGYYVDHISCYDDRRYLYYATDGMAVYVDYHSGSSGYFSCCIVAHSATMPSRSEVCDNVHPP